MFGRHAACNTVPSLSPYDFATELQEQFCGEVCGEVLLGGNLPLLCKATSICLVDLLLRGFRLKQVSFLFVDIVYVYIYIYIHTYTCMFVMICSVLFCYVV